MLQEGIFLKFYFVDNNPAQIPRGQMQEKAALGAKKVRNTSGI